MLTVAVAMALQDRVPTVGDTVWVAVRVAVPSGYLLRPQPIDLGELGQSLGSAEVSYGGDSVSVRYPVAFWHPGNHRIAVPGPIVVSTAGRSDTLPAREVVVPIASVLPAGQDKQTVAARDPAGLLPQSDRSWLPLVVLFALWGGAFGWLRRRSVRRAKLRRSDTPPVAVAAEPAVEPALVEWAALGEGRTALDGWAHLIEARLAGQHLGPERIQTAQPLLERMALLGFDRRGSEEEVGHLIAEARAWMGEADPTR